MSVRVIWTVCGVTLYEWRYFLQPFGMTTAQGELATARLWHASSARLECQA